MKFALVLMMDTRVVEEARVRALVKSAHIRALKARLREKKSCKSGGSAEFVSKDQHFRTLTARIRYSTNLLEEERLSEVEIAEAQEEVSSVVVLA